MRKERQAHKIDDDLRRSLANVSMKGLVRAILVDRDSSKDPRSGRWENKLEYDSGGASHPNDGGQCR